MATPVTVWKDSRGQIHDTAELADAADKRREMLAEIEENCKDMFGEFTAEAIYDYIQEKFGSA